eukprot:CAMPEP_0175476044 /NCGR_PEP_ID=MMETSP0095-20121207/75724_1 /TAXON_ID=311494 /ORGANISM="Alexandrium monilatum, Strain CCMP3105" /LENGTH=98 /DNA_ID=CAMNT_0016777619 /DNA_START=69 /DNA_END=362 /DNA_ORIENTATION=-
MSDQSQEHRHGEEPLDKGRGVDGPQVWADVGEPRHGARGDGNALEDLGQERLGQQQRGQAPGSQVWLAQARAADGRGEGRAYARPEQRVSRQEDSCSR